MKILMLAPGYSPHTQRLIELLLREGCAVTCVDTQNPLSGPRNGYEFIRMPRTRGGRIPYFGKHISKWVHAAQLRSIWRRVRPQVVNVQWVDERAEACANARLRPLVLSCWGSDINHLFQPETLNVGCRRRIGSAIAKSDYVTADSPEVLKRCEQLAGHPVRSKLVFYGVNPAQFKPGYREEAGRLRRQFDISAETKVILSPRRVHPLLGQRHILAAFASIAGDRNIPNAVLMFKHYLSTSDALHLELSQEIERLGLRRSVFWLRETSYDEVPAHYAMADVVVNYPEQDGFPVSLFEAALSQKPVITSCLPAYEGVFGDAFVNVAPSDPVALATAFRRVLTEPFESSSQRVKRAYAIALAVGDQYKTVKMMVEVFQDAGANGSLDGGSGVNLPPREAI